MEDLRCPRHPQHNLEDCPLCEDQLDEEEVVTTPLVVPDADDDDFDGRDF